MAFPVVAATKNSANATISTSHTVDLPAGIVAGNLLIVAFRYSDDSGVITWPAGWTNVVQGPSGGPVFRAGVAYRIADGAEGASITVTTAVAGVSQHMAYRITGAHATQAPEGATTRNVHGSPTNKPNPPDLNPAGWGIQDTLWLAIAHGGSQTVTVYPTDFTANQLTTPNSTGAMATRESAVASLNPGVFTLSGVTNWIAQTIAIRPVGPAGATLTPSATTGDGVTFTASSAIFIAADDERIIVFGASQAAITSVTSSTVVVADILVDFPNTNAIPVGSWLLRLSPQSTVTPSKKGPLGAIITLTAGVETWRTGDVNKYVKINNGIVRLIKRVSGTVMRGKVERKLTATDAAIAGTWDLVEPSWSTERGFPRTVTFNDQRLIFAGSPTFPDTVWGSAVGKFKEFSKGTDDADPFEYLLSSGQLNGIMWVGGSRDLLIGTAGAEWKLSAGINEPLTPSKAMAKPETLWGAEPIMPVFADRVAIYAQRGKQILREMLYSFDVDGYVSHDLTLLNPSILAPGVVQVTFEKFPVPLLWAVREDGSLVSLTYDRSQEVFAWALHSTSGLFRTACSVHATDGSPKFQTWVGVRRTLGNGTIKQYIEFFDQAATVQGRHPLLVDSALSYDGTNNTATLTPGATSGNGVTFTASAASFVAGDVGKQIVDKTSKGRATIVTFTDSTHVVADITSAFPSANPIAISSWGLAVKTVTGLGHLEGLTVQIVGDLAVYPPKVVTGGSVTLDPHALKIDVGLLYIPRVRTNRPAVETAGGNTVFLTKGISKINILFSNTVGAEINGVQEDWRAASDLMDEAVPTSTEIIGKRDLGYDRAGRVEIRQTQPLPITIVAIQKIIEVGDE